MTEEQQNSQKFLNECLREIAKLSNEYIDEQRHNDFINHAVCKIMDVMHTLREALKKPAREYIAIETPCFPNSWKVIMTRFGEMQDHDNSSNLYFPSYAEAQAEADKLNEKLINYE